MPHSRRSCRSQFHIYHHENPTLCSFYQTTSYVNGEYCSRICMVWVWLLEITPTSRFIQLSSVQQRHYPKPSHCLSSQGRITKRKWSLPATAKHHTVGSSRVGAPLQGLTYGRPLHFRARGSNHAAEDLDSQSARAMSSVFDAQAQYSIVYILGRTRTLVTSVLELPSSWLWMAGLAQCLNLGMP